MIPKLELLKSFALSDFPSGSSINFYDDKLYLIGDDANHILILDKSYQEVDTIHLFNSPGKRIPKPEKTDLETSSPITIDGNDYLLVLGSASLEKRMKVILVPLNKEIEVLQFFEIKEFYIRLNARGIREINIEGSTQIGNQLVIANRGNEANPTNHLIWTESGFWESQSEAKISISKLTDSRTGESFLGISELFYVKSNDLLLLTFSSEFTKNSYDDGTIGDSYLGWIETVSDKINQTNLLVDGLINLSDVNGEFKGEKIEGICVEHIIGKEFCLHLISDNDQGQSKLFKVRMTV